MYPDEVKKDKPNDYSTQAEREFWSRHDRAPSATVEAPKDGVEITPRERSSELG